MKKAKILTVLGVLLAMGVTACGGGTNKSSAKPAGSSNNPGSSNVQPGSSNTQPGTSTPATPEKDQTGHIWGADSDVAASGEGVAYKKATCTENDEFIKLTINQSSVTYAEGSKRKDGTPEGYTKLDGNNQSMSVKFNYDSYATGKLFLFGCMDGWGSNSGKKAFSYNGSPNIEVKVNGVALDIAALSDVVYTDFLSGDASDYSDDGYADIGEITLQNGVNEISYKRLASMNTLVKDFVLVIKNGTAPVHEHSYGDWTVTKEATCTEKGSRERVCSCGDKQTEEIAALGHDFTDWANVTEPTCKALGSAERSCQREGCGVKEQKDVNLLAHDLDEETVITRINSDGEKINQYNCKNGTDKVIQIGMKQINGVFKTTAVEGEAEKWTIGDNANKDKADSYKMDKGSALLFKVDISAATKAFLTIGGKYTNPQPRYFYNQKDGGQYGDDPAADLYRYYTKVNDGDFAPITFNALMSDVFGDGSAVCQMPLGEFDLKAGENLIYVRQGNLGYRVTLDGTLNIILDGDASLDGIVPTHVHEAGSEWKSDASEHWHECVAANCDEEGIKLDKAAHDFGDFQVVTAATCTEAGSGKYVCQTCGYEKVEAIPAAHDWNDAVAVAADGEGVAYNKFTCKKCNAIKLEIALDDSMLAAGSVNKNDPAGYLKLKSNNQSFGFKFNYDSQAVGKIYQRGVIDGYEKGGNKNRNVFSGGSGGATDFELTVNGKVIDVSAYKSAKYYEVMPGEVQAGDLSPLTDVESGQVILKNGVNEINYKRLASYNIAMSHIVLIVENFTHDHVEGTEWLSDANSHWHGCTAENCPVEGYRMSEAAHEFDEGVVTQEPTHTATGSKKYTCSVCGYEKIETIPAVAHEFEVGTKTGAYSPLTCSCGATGYQLDVADANADGFHAPAKMKADATWNITGIEAGTYEIRVLCYMDNDGNRSSQGFKSSSEDRYQWKVDDGEYVRPSTGTATYADVGVGKADKVYCWTSTVATVVVGENAASFVMHWSGSGYSLYVSGVRLIKIA